jgi:hypothetical protein
MGTFILYVVKSMGLSSWIAFLPLLVKMHHAAHIKIIF